MKQHHLIKFEVVGSLLAPINLANSFKKKEEKKITEIELDKIKVQIVTEVVNRFNQLGFPLGDGSLNEGSFLNLDKYLSQLKKKGERLKKITQKLRLLKPIAPKKSFKIVKVEVDLPNWSSLDYVSSNINHNDFLKFPNFPKKAEILVLVKKYVDVITNLQCRGVNYIQFNDDYLSYFCDLIKIRARRKNKAMKNAYDLFLNEYRQFINTIIKAVSCSSKNCIFGLHLRRKTEHKDFFFELDYVALGEKWFSDLLVSRYLLEHSDERFANYQYLEWLPKEKVVVLGLMDMGTDELEEVDYLKYRVDEAANYTSQEQLAISNGGSFTTLENIDCLPTEWVKRGSSQIGQWKKLVRLKEASEFIFG